MNIGDGIQSKKQNIRISVEGNKKKHSEKERYRNLTEFTSINIRQASG